MLSRTFRVKKVEEVGVLEWGEGTGFETKARVDITVGVKLHLSEQFRTENEHAFSAKAEGTRIQPYRRYSDLSSTSDLASVYKGR
jgi:hypothetical protein